MRTGVALMVLLLCGAPAWCAAAETHAGLQTGAVSASSSLPDCLDFKGRKVRTLDVTDLGDAGRADFVNSMPVIMLDPSLLGKLPSNLRVFFHMHECAHHRLGHLFAPTDESEKEADCWAIKHGRQRQSFSRDDIVAWRPHFAGSRGSKTGHLPGPARVEFLLSCFDTP